MLPLWDCVFSSSPLLQADERLSTGHFTRGTGDAASGKGRAEDRRAAEGCPEAGDTAAAGLGQEGLWQGVDEGLRERGLLRRGAAEAVVAARKGVHGAVV